MAWRIADNQTSDLSGWNVEMLDQQTQLLEAAGWDMSSFGLSLPDDYGWQDDDTDTETDAETVAPVEAVDSHKVLVFCETQEEEDELTAYALARGLTCQVMR